MIDWAGLALFVAGVGCGSLGTAVAVALLSMAGDD